MSTSTGPDQGACEGKPTEDKRLERLYDYTKFHIGIYLSAAAGVATLIGSEHAQWVLAGLIGNKSLLYVAFLFIVLAGMCGGMVATSVIEKKTFDEFWTSEHRPRTLCFLKGTGENWVHREHGFFWASLLALVVAVVWRSDPPPSPKSPPQATCCCTCQPQPPAPPAQK